MINVRDDRDVSNVLHIVNDRLAHSAKITAALNSRDRETLAETSDCEATNLPGRASCGFAAKGQAAFGTILVKLRKAPQPFAPPNPESGRAYCKTRHACSRPTPGPIANNPANPANPGWFSSSLKTIHAPQPKVGTSRA
jgi:hypothetical protein